MTLMKYAMHFTGQAPDEIAHKLAFHPVHYATGQAGQADNRKKDKGKMTNFKFRNYHII